MFNFKNLYYLQTQYAKMGEVAEGVHHLVIHTFQTALLCNDPWWCLVVVLVKTHWKQLQHCRCKNRRVKNQYKYI